MIQNCMENKSLNNIKYILVEVNLKNDFYNIGYLKKEIYPLRKSGKEILHN